MTLLIGFAVALLFPLTASAHDKDTCEALSHLESERTAVSLDGVSLPIPFILNGKRRDDPALKPKAWIEETDASACRPISYLFQKNSLELVEYNVCGPSFMVGNHPHPADVKTLKLVAKEEKDQTIVDCEYDELDGKKSCLKKFQTVFAKNSKGEITKISYQFQDCVGSPKKSSLALD